MSIFRNYLVDLLSYMPEHLTKDRETVTLLLVESEEHNLQEKWLQEIFKQFFIETATWGLAKYENDYGLVANPGDTYQQRRNRIYLKLQSKQTSTKEFMAKLAARYFSKDAIIIPKEDNPNDSFWIINKGGTLLYAEDFFEAIDTYIPAHLGFTFQMERDVNLTGEDSLKYGLANLVDGMANIGLARPPDIVLPYSAEALTGSAGRRQVGAGPVTLSARLAEEIAFAYINSGFSDIPANMNDLPEWIRSITKPSRILHKIGITYDRKGRQKIPLALPTVTEVIRSPVIITGKSGGRLYGLALPEDGRQCVHLGHAGVVTGRGRLEADLSDLADWIKRITEPTRATVKIAIEAMRRGKRTYPLERPPDTALAMLAAAKIRAAGGSTIGIDPEDLPDFMRDFLKSSRAAPVYGIHIEPQGTRRLFPAPPEDAIQSLWAAAKIQTAGRRKLLPAMPGQAEVNLPVGGAHARVGRVSVGYGIEGLPRDFWDLLEPSVASPGISIKTIPTGKKNIGISQRIEEGFSLLSVGFLDCRGGRAEIGIEDSDLPETYRDILTDAVITPYMAAKLLRGGLKTIHGSRPPDAALAMLAAAKIRAAGGRKTIGINPEDLPDFMRDFLKSSRAAPRYGIKTFSNGAKHISTAKPPDGQQFLFAGITTGAGGRKRISPSLPQPPAGCVRFGHAEAVTGAGRLSADPADLAKYIDDILTPARAAFSLSMEIMGKGKKKLATDTPKEAGGGLVIGNAYTITGRVVIGADRGDLPPRKRARAHVGIMQAGLSAVG